MRADSTNPTLERDGAGEAEVARLLAERMQRAGLEVDVWDAAPGRPNVVGRLAGTGGGRSLMLCGHTDVVGGSPEQFRPELRDGRMYGRGTERHEGRHRRRAGARWSGWRRAAAGRRRAARLGDRRGVGQPRRRVAGRSATGPTPRVLPEQSDLDVVFAHGGFVWYDVISTGKESAGGEPQHGVDGIALAGTFLSGIIALDRELETHTTPEWGRPNVHASTIRGGQNYPSYPAECVIAVERCLMPGESVAQADAEIEQLLARGACSRRPLPGARRDRDRARARLLRRDDPIVLDGGRRRARPARPAIRSCEATTAGWTRACWSRRASPASCFGPTGAGVHTVGRVGRPAIAGGLCGGVRGDGAPLLRWRDMTEALLELRGLRVSFRTEQGVVQAVDGLDLTLQSGEVLGVVGESGSGKSVSMLALLGLIDDPNVVIEGEALFRGRDLLKMGERELRGLRGRQVSMIFQDPMTSLNPVYAVGWQIAEQLRAHETGAEAAGAAARGGAARERGHPRRRSPRRRLPAPVLGRYAAARHDRDGAVLQPGAADRR